MHPTGPSHSSWQPPKEARRTEGKEESPPKVLVVLSEAEKLHLAITTDSLAVTREQVQKAIRKSHKESKKLPTARALAAVWQTTNDAPTEPAAKPPAKQASSSSDAPASDSLVTAEKAVATPNSEPLDQAMLEPIGSDAGGASNSDADFKVRCEQFEKFEREFPWRVLIVRPAARDLSGLDRPDKDAAMNHLATIASGIWSGHAVKHLTEGVPSSLCA